MRRTGGDVVSSAFLQVVVAGPLPPRRAGERDRADDGAAAHTVALAQTLRDAGHEVALLPAGAGGTRSLWSGATRALREADAVLLVHGGPSSVPRLLALAGAVAAVRDGGAALLPARLQRRLGLDPAPPPPAAVVLVAHSSLVEAPRTPARRLTQSLVSRCDAVIVHDEPSAAAARDLGAHRVCSVPLPPLTPVDSPAPLGQPAGPSSVESTPALPPPTVTVPPPAVSVGGGSARRGPWAPSAPALHATSGPYGVPPAAGAPPAAPAGPVEGAPDDDVEPELSAEWARYVGTIEALAAPLTPGARESSLEGFEGFEGFEGSGGPGGIDGIDGIDGVDQVGRGGVDGDTGRRDPGGSLTRWGGVVRSPLVAAARAIGPRLRLAQARRAHREPVSLGRLDVPEWVAPTDVLLDQLEADDARRVAEDLGLPRVADPTSAWAALGALAAVVRIVDDGRRSAVIVHESGQPGRRGGRGAAGSVGGSPTDDSSPFGTWAHAAGFAPVALGLTDPDSSLADLDLDLESLDALVRIHPHGCDADDVDEAVGQAAWALREGGILVVTVPLTSPGAPGVPGGVTPADLRGIVARAHDSGLTLVGDLDGDVTARLRAGAAAAADRGSVSSDPARVRAGARPGDTAYGMARLVLRRG